MAVDQRLSFCAWPQPLGLDSWNKVSTTSNLSSHERLKHVFQTFITSDFLLSWNKRNDFFNHLRWQSLHMSCISFFTRRIDTPRHVSPASAFALLMTLRQKKKCKVYNKFHHLSFMHCNRARNEKGTEKSCRSR